MSEPPGCPPPPAPPAAGPAPAPDATCAADAPTGLLSLADYFPRLSLDEILARVSLAELRVKARSLLRDRSAQTRQDFRTTAVVTAALQRSSGNFHPARGWNNLEHFNHCFWQAMRWTLEDNRRTVAHANRLRLEYLEDLFSAEFDLAEERDVSVAMQLLEEFRERNPADFEFLLNYQGHGFTLGDIVTTYSLIDPKSDAENPAKAAEKKLGRRLGELKSQLRKEARRRGLKIKA